MRLVILFICVYLVGCVGQTYRPPPLSPPKVTTFGETSLESAVAEQTARIKHGQHLLWPLLVANTELCEKKRWSFGLMITDRNRLGQDLQGITSAQLALTGVNEKPFLFDVMPHGPGWQAGLRADDVIVSIDGKPIKQASDAEKILKRRLIKHQATSFTLNREVELIEVTLTPIEICDASLSVAQSDVLNAYAYAKSITLHAGLMRLIDDEGLQFVVAHELAHVAIRHTDKLKRNLLVSGGLVYVPLLTVAGDMADTLLNKVDRSREHSLSGSALGLTPYSVAFEAEADYVALYMLARANLSLDGAQSAFDLFAREKPSSVWKRYTHPLTPERMHAAQATITEIEQKQLRGEVLLPQKHQR